MTFKQTMRRLLAILWQRCANIATDKIKDCSYHSPNHAAWWEEFLERCDKRVMKHAEFVPGQYQTDAASERAKEAK